MRSEEMRLHDDGDHDAESDDDEIAVDRLVGAYIDRYNLGEPLSAELILEEHPGLAPEILAQLEAFVEIEGTVGIGLVRELGNFQLVRKLGAGGMGVVYEAWESSLDRKVAVKLLPAGAAANQTTLRRFLREARAAGRLQHRNIVPVYATGLAAGTPYYSMEYVDGETLAALRTRLGLVEGPPETEAAERRALIEIVSLLPDPDARERRSSESLASSSLPALRARHARAVAHAFAEVARGLQHAHEEGIVHRDIKPSNLILERERAGSGSNRASLRIFDFGLARLTGDQTLTVDGTLLGTPLYMSPEQIRSAEGNDVEIDRRSDVYSLGLCLYESLAWRHPFGPGIGPRLYRDTLDRLPPALSPTVHRDLDAIVSKCLHKSPQGRYATAEALAQDLDRYVRSEPVEAKPIGPWRRRARRLWGGRRRLARAALVSVLLAGAAFGGYQLFSEKGGILSSRVWEGGVNGSYWRVSRDGRRMVAVDWAEGNVIVTDLLEKLEWREVTRNRDWETLTHYGNGTIISPDGAMICYCWEDSETGIGELYIADADADADGSEPRRMDPGDTSYYPEDWSADGALVLVQREGTRSGRFPAGCSLLLLSVESGGIEWEWEFANRAPRPRLSPEGDWILYRSETEVETGRWDIFAHSVSTNDTLPFLRSRSDDQLIGFSADGTQVVFTSDRGGARGLWTVGFDSGHAVDEPRCVRSAFDGEGAGITGDNTLFYTESTGGSDLLIAGIGERGEIDVEGARPGSNRFQRRCYSPSWSPDGTQLAYRTTTLGCDGAYDACSWRLILQDVSTGIEEEIHATPTLRGSFKLVGPGWLDDRTLAFVTGSLDGSSSFHVVDVQKRVRYPLLEVSHRMAPYGICFGTEPRAIWYRVEGKGIFRLDVPDDVSSMAALASPRPITVDDGNGLQLSPDGRWIAFHSKKMIWLVPSDGSSDPESVCALGTGPDRIQRTLGWRGSTRLFVRMAHGGVEELDLETGNRRPLIGANSAQHDTFVISPPGDRVVFCREVRRLRISRLQDFLR